MLLFLLLSSHFSLCEFGSYNATKNDSDTSSFFDEKLFLNFFPFFFFFPLVVVVNCTHIFSVQQLSWKLLIPLHQSARVEVSIHDGRNLLRCQPGFNKMEKMMELWMKSSLWKTNYIWNYYIRQMFLFISFVYQVSLTWL